MLCDASEMLCYVVLWHARVRDVVLCDAMLCYAMLCYAMLLLWCDMLCHASVMLC